MSEQTKIKPAGAAGGRETAAGLLPYRFYYITEAGHE